MARILVMVSQLSFFVIFTFIIIVCSVIYNSTYPMLPLFICCVIKCVSALWFVFKHTSLFCMIMRVSYDRIKICFLFSFTYKSEPVTIVTHYSRNLIVCALHKHDDLYISNTMVHQTTDCKLRWNLNYKKTIKQRETNKWIRSHLYDGCFVLQ